MNDLRAVQTSSIPIVKLITFGGGDAKFHDAALRLARQANAFTQINSVKAYLESDLPEDYYEIFNNFPNRFPAGYGLWSWKPFLIQHELRSLNQNDILIYVDAGCEMNPLGSQKLDYYLSQTSSKEGLLFELDLPNRYWSKNHPLLTGNAEHFFRNQIMATVIFLKNTERIQRFVNHWLNLCSLNDGELLKNNLPDESQIKGFKLHRNDQSCLSTASYDEGFKPIADPTYFKYWPDGKYEPILALRNGSGISRLEKVLNPRFSTLVKSMVRGK